jgi:hypothetical protein
MKRRVVLLTLAEKIAGIYLDVVCRLLVFVTQLGDYLGINYLSN